MSGGGVEGGGLGVEWAFVLSESQKRAGKTENRGFVKKLLASYSHDPIDVRLPSLLVMLLHGIVMLTPSAVLTISMLTMELAGISWKTSMWARTETCSPLTIRRGQGS